jgi:hypothetical protein
MPGIASGCKLFTGSQLRVSSQPNRVRRQKSWSVRLGSGSTCEESGEGSCCCQAAIGSVPNRTAAKDKQTANALESNPFGGCRSWRWGLLVNLDLSPRQWLAGPKVAGKVSIPLRDIRFAPAGRESGKPVGDRAFQFKASPVPGQGTAKTACFLAGFLKSVAGGQQPLRNSVDKKRRPATMELETGAKTARSCFRRPGAAKSSPVVRFSAFRGQIFLAVSHDLRRFFPCGVECNCGQSRDWSSHFSGWTASGAGPPTGWVRCPSPTAHTASS